MKIHDLSVSYGKRNILHDVSLSFSEGIHFITGLNGSGKSTLFRSIAGAIPFKGKIALNEIDLSEITPGVRARKIAVLEQKLNTPFPITVAEFVLMGRFPWLGWLGNYSKRDYGISEDALIVLGIDNLKDRLIAELSGGELQKVFIARALCQQAQVLLLDEPEQSLDPKNKAMLLGLLQQIAAGGKIVLCTTHEPSYLGIDAITVIGLANGKVVLNEKGPCNFEKLNSMVYEMQDNINPLSLKIPF